MPQDLENQSLENQRPLRDITTGEAKRVVVYSIALLLAVGLFLYLVHQVFVALLLGVVAAVYLLPVQTWLEDKLQTRASSALITIGLIVLPLVAVAGYAWYELSGYSDYVQQERESIIASISESLARAFPVERESTRYGLDTAFAEAITRSAAAVESLRESSALLLASASLFFFTVFYVLTQRNRLARYIKVRVPGDYLPLYEQLTTNIGGALRGALRAVFIDQTIKAVVICVLNFAFGVPLALVLGLVTFLIGFFPLLGEWAVYIPVAIYLFVFAGAPLSAAIYLGIGIALTLSSSLFLRPKLAAASTDKFNFYWMLVALVAGVYTFGVPGIVLGPAILGFVKAVTDTFVGDVNYETSLLKEEREAQDEEPETVTLGAPLETEQSAS